MTLHPDTVHYWFEYRLCTLTYRKMLLFGARRRNSYGEVTYIRESSQPTLGLDGVE